MRISFERLVEVGVADAPLAPQAGRDPLQAVGQGVEHGDSGYVEAVRPGNGQPAETGPAGVTGLRRRAHVSKLSTVSFMVSRDHPPTAQP